MSNWFDPPATPTLPVIDLISGVSGSSESSITEKDMYKCQARWDFVKIYRLDVGRRKDLCKKLVSLTKKLAPGLVGSQALTLWSRVAKDPSWPDQIMSKPEPSSEDA